MGRGKNAVDGEERVAPNGYHYLKQNGQWRLKHHVVAEDKVLGRPLRKNERVYFRDTNRANLDPSNLIVRQTRNGKEQKIERIKKQILLLQEELEELESGDGS